MSSSTINRPHIQLPHAMARPWRARLTGRTLTYGVLMLGLLIWLLPFAWMALGSFKTQGEILRRPPTWWPESPTSQNYDQWFGQLHLSLIHI